MPKKPESRLQRTIRAALQRELGGFWYKVHGSPFQPAGIPDLAGVVGGRACFVEVKRPKGEVSRVQYVRMIELASAGAVVTVATTPIDAVSLVAVLLADMRLRYCHRCGRVGAPVRYLEASVIWTACPHCEHPCHRLPE